MSNGWTSLFREGLQGNNIGVTGTIDFGELVPGGNGTVLLYAFLRVQQLPETSHSSVCVDLQLTDEGQRSPFIAEFCPDTGRWWRTRTATVGGGLSATGPSITGALTYDISRVGAWSVDCSPPSPWFARFAAMLSTNRLRRRSWGTMAAHAVFQVPDSQPSVVLTARAWATPTGSGMRQATEMRTRVVLPRGLAREAASGS